jgi:hypothetical protein
VCRRGEPHNPRTQCPSHGRLEPAQYPAAHHGDVDKH